MALALNDRVQQTGTANTTVSFTLSGAVTGFQSFAVIGNGNTTYYSAFDGAGNWEVGLGTYSTTGPTLTRTTILSSSNSNTAVTFSGTVSVFVTYPSSKAIYEDASGNVSPLGTISSGVWNGSTVGVAYGGTGVTSSSGANSVVLRDANQNVTANNIFPGYAAVTAAAGTTVLTAASAFYQRLSGSTTQTFQLPNATTMPNGAAFSFDNDSSGSLTVVDSASATVDVVPAGGYGYIFLEDNATSAGSWGKYAFLPGSYNFSTTAADFGNATISNAVWNGTTIGTAYGGTGLTTFTAANNAIYSTSASALAAGTLPVAAGGTGLTTLTAGYIPYGNGTSAYSSSANLQFNGTQLGIGIAPASPYLATTYSATDARILNIGENVNAGYLTARYGTNAAGPSNSLRKYRGTYASPLAVASGDIMGTINFQAWGGTTLQILSAIASNVDTYTSDTNISSYLTFATSPSGSAAPTERMRIDSAGNVGIGVTPSAWGSTYKAIQVGAGSTLWGDNTAPSGTYLSSNLYFNGTNRIYIGGTYAPAEYSLYNGIHTWSSAAAGTAGTTATLIARMSINAAGVVNIAGLTASSAVATDASKNLVSVTNTGSGNNVLATSPTITGATLTTAALNGTLGATTPSTVAATTGSFSGALTLAGTSTNQFIAGTGDAATFTTYNFALSGWNGMAFYNPTSGGAYPNTTSGVIDFRNGVINMKGGFQVNGTAVALTNGNITGNAATATASSIAGGAVWENAQTIAANYTMTAGKSGTSAGPITINSGVTVTIPTGSRWVVL